MLYFSPWNIGTVARNRTSLIVCLLLGFGALLLPNQVNGQETEPDFFHRNTTKVKPKKEALKDQNPNEAISMDTARSGFYRQYAIGVSAGTQAFYGFDVAATIKPKWSARLGYNFLEVSINETMVDVGDQQLLFNAKLDQSHVSLIGNYDLVNNKIRLSAGLAYYLRNELSGEGIMADSLDFEDLRISPDEVGFIKGTISFKNTISPYFGVGFGPTVPNKRVAFNFDLGAFYRGAPQVELEATNLLKNNVNNQQIIEDAISFIQWWPVLSFRLAVRVN